MQLELLKACNNVVGISFLLGGDGDVFWPQPPSVDGAAVQVQDVQHQQRGRLQSVSGPVPLADSWRANDLGHAPRQPRVGQLAVRASYYEIP